MFFDVTQSTGILVANASGNIVLYVHSSTIEVRLGKPTQNEIKCELSKIRFTYQFEFLSKKKTS